MVRLNEAAIAGLAFFADSANALPQHDKRQIGLPGIFGNPAQQVDCYVFGGYFWGGCNSGSSNAKTSASAAQKSVCEQQALRHDGVEKLN